MSPIISGGGGGGGTVTGVTAADTSIVVAGTAAAPTIATGTLDVIAAQHAPAANWSNNSKKITALANGTAAQDAAAFGQIPTVMTLSYGSGDYLWPPIVTIGNTAGIDGDCFYVRVYVFQTQTFDRIAVRVVAGVALTTARLGIFADSGGRPTTLILDAGTVATTTTGADATITISQQLTPAAYWLACQTEGGAATFAGLSNGTPFSPQSAVGGSYSGGLLNAHTGPFASNPSSLSLTASPIMTVLRAA